MLFLDIVFVVYSIPKTNILDITLKNRLDCIIQELINNVEYVHESGEDGGEMVSNDRESLYAQSTRMVFGSHSIVPLY